MKKDILVVGYGYVGSSIAGIFDKHCNVEIYDIQPPHNTKKLSTMISNKDFIFICVGTPMDTSPNTEGKIVDNGIIQTLDAIREANYFNGVIVIKSTVMYSSIEKYIKQYNMKIVVNPEFLSQNSFIDDTFSTRNFLIGGEPRYCQKVIDLYEGDSIYRFNGSTEPLKFRCVTIEQAIQFKYIRNIFGAYLVTFWEWVHDQTNGNSRLMSSLYKEFSLPSDMSQVGLDGYRGFGGACFPKDVAAWNFEYKDEVTEMLLNYNKKIQG